MFTKKFTVLQWIYFWGLLTLMLAWLAEMTQSNWIVVATIISAVILVVGTLFTFYKICHRKWILRHKPFSIIYLYTASLSQESQFLRLAIEMNTKQVIEYLSLRFEGRGEIPNIVTMHNCISGVILKDRPIPFISHIDNNWCWENQATFQQRNISLAIEFMSVKPFDGFLKIDLKCDEIDRIVYKIPFQISDTQELYKGSAQRTGLFE
jgi:hypothetical protein